MDKALRKRMDAEFSRLMKQMREDYKVGDLQSAGEAANDIRLLCERPEDFLQSIGR